MNMSLWESSTLCKDSFKCGWDVESDILHIQDLKQLCNTNFSLQCVATTINFLFFDTSCFSQQHLTGTNYSNAGISY